MCVIGSIDATLNFGLYVEIDSMTCMANYEVIFVGLRRRN